MTNTKKPLPITRERLMEMPNDLVVDRDFLHAFFDRIDEQAKEIAGLRKQVAELKEIKQRWYAEQADPASESEIEKKAWELRIHRGLYLADAYEAAEKWVADRTQRRAEKKKGGS